MPTFQCFDKQDQLHVFEYRTFHEGTKTTFRVYAVPRLANEEFFDLVVEELSESLVRVVMINHQFEPAYMSKGIPDALLPIASQYLGATVQSSPSLGGGAYRTTHATKMWRRLESKGLATYDPQTDIYTLS